MVGIAVILFTGYSIHAQDLSKSKIQWNSNKFIDLLSNDIINKSVQFITYDNTKIEWIQKNGSIVYSFKIISINGNWSDVNTNGSISFGVAFDGITGSFSFSRIDDVIKIRLDLKGGAGDIKNEYTITNAETL